MDTIYDYLKADHEKVANLFKQFEKAPTYKAKFEYISFLISELLLHAEAESETFYKELEKHQKSADEALHGEEEHQEIAAKINEILSLKTLNEAWEAKVFELKKLVEHHVSEEEGKIFNHAKKVLTDYEAYVIREQMHDMKDKILTRNDKSSGASKAQKHRPSLKTE